MLNFIFESTVRESWNTMLAGFVPLQVITIANSLLFLFLYFIQNVSYQHSISHQAERYVSVLTAGAMVGAVVSPHIAFDHAMAILIPLHTHWGLEQVWRFGTSK